MSNYDARNALPAFEKPYQRCKQTGMIDAGAMGQGRVKCPECKGSMRLPTAAGLQIITMLARQKLIDR